MMIHGTLHNSPPEKSGRASHSDHQKANGPGQHILLADDNYANRLVAQTVLLREGYILTLAKDGREAVCFANVHPYDLIILDIQMPILDGLEAFKAIRDAQNPNMYTPIFALTAYSSQDDIKTYQDIGISVVLEKPLKPGDVKAAWLKHHTYTAKSKSETDGPRSQTVLPNSDIVAQRHTPYPLLDPQIMSRLNQIANKQALTRLVRAFWTDIDLFITQMDTYLPNATSDNRDYLDAFRKCAHAIKGATINVGALRAHHLAARLQNAPVGALPTLYRDLRTALRATRPVLLTTLINGYPAADAPGVTHCSDGDAQTKQARTQT